MVGDPSTHLKDCHLDLLALELRFFGATLTETLDENVSHVLVDERYRELFSAPVVVF